MAEVLISMEGIDKSFPGVKALDNVHFELRAGEVHALIGENGAGKSTLMKVLTGNYQKDAGKIFVKGREVEIKTPGEATDLGISMIHQELSIIPHLSLAQNIFLGREGLEQFRFIVDKKGINKKAKKLFESMHLDLEPKVKAEQLSVAKQQMTEIAKAVSRNSEIIIMDEPTAALTDSEIEELFKIIYKFRKRGAGIVYISHRMEELNRICDRITIMRDGQYVSTSNIKDITIDEIIAQMVGRTISSRKQDRESCGTEEIVMEAKNITRGKELQNISFHLKKGEILGFAGLMGAGRTELSRAIFGAERFEKGEICVHGKAVKVRTPKDAVENGICYLSEDRKKYGLALSLTVEDNIAISSLRELVKLKGIIDRKKVSEKAAKYVKDLNIKTPSFKQKAKNLSGGNQQKLVIGKWLLRNSEILIFDEPTRGIDVGAKSEIYRLLDSLVREGKSIIMISSELPEILRMSDRIIIMCEGRITGELSAGEASQERIMQYATKRD